jgi:N-acetyl-anhydromuramyl-L-alanine amidase AmpD
MESLENRKADLEHEFQDQTPQQVSELKNQLAYANYGMTADEFEKFKSDARQSFSLDATPAEMDEAFKNYRV